MPSDEWYREEYKGREDELISSQEILDRTGYTRSVLSKWKSRHADMPKEVVKRWRKTGGQTRGHGAFDLYWVRDEMLPFLKKRLALAEVHGSDKHARYEVVSARVREDDKRLERIADQERILKDKLTKLREEREQIWDSLVDDRRFVAAYEREKKAPQTHETP
ncbi:hypothetical protein [Streptomyces chattanoogensis]|uniref:hypothetical protein n=1 Tax=Streptomyces chattanoogensis TaxID=66876 RepID=UPI0036C0A2DE